MPGNLPTTHHAGSCKHCIVHGIGVDVATTTNELDFDHHKIVDVLKIISNNLLRDSRVNSSNDEVSRGSDADLARNMTGQDELTIAPPNLHL